MGVEGAHISDTEWSQHLLTHVTATQSCYWGLLQLSGSHWTAITSQKATGGPDLVFTPHSFPGALRFILPHTVLWVMIPLCIIPLWGQQSNRIITIWATVLLQIPPWNSATRQTRTSGKIMSISRTRTGRMYLRKTRGLGGAPAHSDSAREASTHLTGFSFQLLFMWQWLGFPLCKMRKQRETSP